ncbi:RHS repeat-associated core domain-containing protein [Paraburkholderia jirisanensis]
MAQYSAARNEDGYLSGTPDARTGLFSKTLTLGKISGNYHSGPEFSVKLGFDPQTPSSTSTWGSFGLGWTLSLCAYTPDATALPLVKGHLTLLSGGTYYTEPTTGELKLEGYLLKDMVVNCTSTPDLTFSIVHKSGARELYETIPMDNTGAAYLTQITDKTGRSLYLSYHWDGSTSQLVSVSDDTETMLFETALDSTLSTITLYPGAAEESSFSLQLQGGQLVLCTGPENYQAEFSYTFPAVNNQLTIASVTDNQGLQEFVDYGIGITQPGGVLRQATVSTYRRITDPKSPDSDYLATYLFDDSEANYLGYPVIGTTDSNRDSLLNYADAFSYTTNYTESLGSNGEVKKTTTTYNKFHSITEQAVSYGSSGCIVTKTCEYNVDDTKAVDGQVPTYKLPTKLTQTWTNTADGASSPYAESHAFSWSDAGNIERIIASTGVVTDFTYYPADSNETNCPPDPNGFEAHLKSKTVTPAKPTDESLPVAPTRETLYSYELLPVYAGAPEDGAQQFIVQTQKSLQEVAAGENPTATAISTQHYTHISDTADLLSHGRLWKVADDVYHLESGSTVACTTQHEFTYLPVDATTSIPQRQVLVTTTGYDGVTQQMSFSRSCLTGKIIQIADTTTSSKSGAGSELTIDFTYDGLGRLTSKVACMGSPDFKSGQTYIYDAVDLNSDKPYACKTTIDAYGVGTRTYYDGSKNVLFEETQDADMVVSDNASAYYEMSRTEYNPIGQTLSKTLTDYHSSWAGAIATRTTYEYDDWGNQYKTTHADGHQEISQEDPLTQTTTSWLVVDGTKEQTEKTVKDLFGNPLTITRLSSEGNTYSVESYVYDGSGREIKHTDVLGGVTVTVYDCFDRPSLVTRADGSQTQFAYANFSKDQLATKLSASDAENADQYDFGTRTFDGLGRLTQSIIGGRTTVYEYDANDAAPTPGAITLPTGVKLTYTYQPEISYALLSIESSASDEPTQTYDYVPATALQKSAVQAAAANGDKSSWSYDYFLSGRTKGRILTYVVDGKSATRNDFYTYSLGGRLVDYTDVQGQKHSHTYNSFGQVTTSNLDAGAVSQYVYDGGGRLSNAVTQDIEGYTLSTTLTYDVQGREETRTLTVTSPSDNTGKGQTLNTQKQTLTYNVADAVVGKVLERDANVIRTENYSYTSIGQLQEYQCSGTEYPESPGGYRLLDQQFEFDFIGNIVAVTSSVLDATGASIENRATYQYAGTDRTQLTGITNDKIAEWNATLEYDKNGNLTKDEQGRFLTVNSQNQLVELSDSSQTLLGNYWYDATGTLLAEKAVSDTDATTLYYQSGQLVSELRGTTIATYLKGSARVLADAGTKTVQLLGADQQGSIVQITDEGEVSYRAYDPYGYCK